MLNLSTNRHFGAITAVVMALAVTLCGTLYYYAQVNDIQTSGIVMQYETELFGRDVITLEIEADPDDWQEMLDNATQEQYISCNVTVNGTKFENVGIRPKGNSSLTSVASSDSDRYSFRIKFDEYVDGQTCFGLDQFVVNNIQSDATYMKEYLSYELMNFMGVTTPLYTYADISVNGETWGFYLAIESYRESFLARTYGSTSGNLYNVKMSGMGEKPGGQDGGADFKPPELAQGDGPNDGNTAPQTGDPSVKQTSVGPDDGQGGEPPAFPDDNTDGGGGTGQRPSAPSDSQSGGAGKAPSAGAPNESGQPTAGGDDTLDGETESGSGQPSAGDDFTGGGTDGENRQTDRGGKMGGMMGFGGSGGGSLQYTDDSIDSYSSIFDNAVLSKTGEEDMERVITALQKLSEREELEEYFDVDQIIRYFAVHTVVVNLDSYVSSMQQNFYLYENDGVVTILPWDYNLAFGGFQSGSTDSVVNFPIDTPVSGVSVEDRPLLAMILENEEYAERYHSYLQKIVDEYYNSGLFETSVEKLKARISDYVRNDPSAFYTYEEYEAAVPQLVELCKLRAESIEGQLNGSIPSTTEAQNEDSSKLVSAASVSLSALGAQGGGMGGGGGFSFPGGDQDFDPEDGGFGETTLDPELLEQVREIIGESTEVDSLTEEQRAQLSELGLTEEEITSMTQMLSRFSGMGGGQRGFGGMQFPGQGNGDESSGGATEALGRPDGVGSVQTQSFSPESIAVLASCTGLLVLALVAAKLLRRRVR